jgi:hypothetical protein
MSATPQPRRVLSLFRQACPRHVASGPPFGGPDDDDAVTYCRLQHTHQVQRTKDTPSTLARRRPPLDLPATIQTPDLVSRSTHSTWCASSDIVRWVVAIAGTREGQAGNRDHGFSEQSAAMAKHITHVVNLPNVLVLCLTRSVPITYVADLDSLRAPAW